MNCDFCCKTFASKQNFIAISALLWTLKRQNQSKKLHGLFFQKILSGSNRERVEEKHSRTKQKLCICWNSLFSDTKSFNKHLQEVYSLPPDTQTKNSKRKLPQASAFSETVETHFLSKRRSWFLTVHDRPEGNFWWDHKRSCWSRTAKVQVSAKVKSEKPAW